MQTTKTKLTKIAIFITVAILVATLFFYEITLGTFIAIALITIPLLLFVSFLVGMFSAWIGIEIISEDTETKKDTDVDVVLDEELKITEYGPVIGKLDGEDCHEYVIVKIDQENKDVKLEYVGPFDEKAGFTEIGDGWFVVLHGVLYLEPRNVISD